MDATGRCEKTAAVRARSIWSTSISREVLDFRPDQGIIRLHEQRVVILSAAAMGLLRKELIDTLGLETARRLLLRFGYADGYHDAVSLRDRSKWANPLEGLRAGVVLHRLEGIVRAEIIKVEHDAASGRFEEEVVWHDSYVAEQHVHHYGKSDDAGLLVVGGLCERVRERLSRAGDLLSRNRVPGARRAKVLGRRKGCRELGRRAGERFASTFKARILARRSSAFERLCTSVSRNSIAASDSWPNVSAS